MSMRVMDANISHSQHRRKVEKGGPGMAVAIVLSPAGLR